VTGLYATGEVACSGVHGANRLASNSLLEGLVFSRRIAQVLPDELRPWSDVAVDERPAGVVSCDVRRAIQEQMTDRVGVLRSATGVTAAEAALRELLEDDCAVQVETATWETTNLLTIAIALAEAARRREETRGSHWREDFPDRDDFRWAGHFDAILKEGVSALTFLPAPATDGAPS
jgi:L-aspartate oxidase